MFNRIIERIDTYGLGNFEQVQQKVGPIATREVVDFLLGAQSRRGDGGAGSTGALPHELRGEDKEEDGEENRQNSDNRDPSVFNEALGMTLASIAIFGIVDLRRIAGLPSEPPPSTKALMVGNVDLRRAMVRGLSRKTTSGEERVPGVCALPPEVKEKFRQLPVDAADLLRVAVENREEIERTIGPRSKELKFVVSLLEMEDRLRRGGLSDASPTAMRVQLEYVGDESSDTECVYAIFTTRVRRRITVAFRGSITIQDWKQDSKGIPVSIPNPVSEGFADDQQPKEVRVHMGFHDYLYRNNKLQTIMEKTAMLCDKYPDHQLYVCGHSLGGALALLFAFEAAACSDPRIRKPVTCISVGNPKAGNLDFRAAFQLLERQGKLRCLCIHNHMDIVPLMPDLLSVNPCLLLACRKRSFRHVGFRLKLYPDGRGFSISYHGSQYDTIWYDVVRGIIHFINVLAFVPFLIMGTYFVAKGFAERHDFREYLHRELRLRKELEEIQLNDLYRREVDPGLYQPTEV